MKPSSRRVTTDYSRGLLAPQEQNNEATFISSLALKGIKFTFFTKK
jgi:hypothetical protein